MLEVRFILPVTPQGEVSIPLSFHVLTHVLTMTIAIQGAQDILR